MSVVEGSQLAVARYIEMLESKGAKPIEDTENPTTLNHLLWMCLHLKKNIVDNGRGFPIDKFSRWIGYIQGVMTCKGLTTVNAERNVTRPWFTEAK